MGSSMSSMENCRLYGPQLREDVGILPHSYLFAQSTHCQAQRVHIELPQPEQLMVDGDLYSDVEAIEYKTEPEGLLFCTGKATEVCEAGEAILPELSCRQPTAMFLQRQACFLESSQQ